MATLALACEGKVLDVGTATRSGVQGADAAPDEDASTPPVETPVDPAIAPIAGVWVMVRHDGMFGSELKEPAPPPMELDIGADGSVFRSLCVRSGDAVEPCQAAATTDCKPGEIEARGQQWRIDIPAISIGNTPEQGETFLTEDGTLVVRYINPTFSAGYFRRIGESGAKGGCR